MVKWEYTRVSADCVESLTNQLNGLGEEGWELVAVHQGQRPYLSDNLYGYLKRQVQVKNTNMTGCN